MKLKFIINKLFAAALIMGVLFSVSSCKDNDADLFAQLRDDDATLKGQIDDLSKRMDQCKNECRTAIMAEVNELLKDYVKTSDLPDFSQYVTQTQLDQRLADYVTTLYLTQELNNYYTKSEILALLPDTSGFLTEDQIVALIQSMIPSCSALTADQIQAMIDQSLTTYLNNYYSKTEVDQLLEQNKCNCQNVLEWIHSTEFFEYVKSLGFVTEDQLSDFVTSDALAAYVTLVDLESRGFVTSSDVATMLNGYVTSDDLATILDEYLKKNDLDLTPYLKSEDLGQAIDQLIAGSGTNFTNLVDALTAVETVSTKVSSLEGTVGVLEGDVSTLKTNLEQLGIDFTEFKSNVTEDISGIKSRLTQVENQVNALTGRLNSLITSIVCQSIYNPVFGTLTLPVDVRSNILMGYYGDPQNEGQIPDSDTMNAYNGNDGNVFTDDDYLFLAQNCGFTPFEYNANTRFFDGNIGYVYMTVNPVANDFSGVRMALENSKGEESPVKVDAITPSTDLISFGYSRANNGFYEAKATVNPNDLSKIKVNIEPGLKEAVKDVVKDRKASDLAQLGKILYRQFDGFLPALALRAGWQDGDKQNAVYSQYNIAATAFQPLSFSFAYGQSFRHDFKLPDWWGNFDMTFDVPTMTWTIPQIHINTDELHLSINVRKITIQISENDKLYVVVEMPQFDSTGKYLGTVPTTIVVDNIDGFVDAFEDQLTDYINSIMQNEVRAEFDRVIDDLVAQMQHEVDNMMHSLESQISDNLENVINDIQNQLNDKISKFTGKLDRFTPKMEEALKRINKFLADPNHYLQATMFYSANNSTYGHMAETKAFPTQVVLAGGNALTLIPSTYNAELVTPAYRKFVAVTDVYTSSASARGGNADCLKVLKNANSQPYMCEVIEGRRLTVPLSLEKVNGQNTTYEIVYQALDYHGKLSTVKSYITIK